jgi:hypothetical protein
MAHLPGWSRGAGFLVPNPVHHLRPTGDSQALADRKQLLSLGKGKGKMTVGVGGEKVLDQF